MAAKKRPPIRQNQLQGLKYFRNLWPLLDRLHDIGTEREIAPTTATSTTTNTSASCSSTSSTAWSPVFVVIVASSVLTVLGGLTARYLAPDGPFPFPKAIFDPRQTAAVMRNRAVRLAVIGYFGHQWELYAMWAWIFAFSRAVFTVNGDADSARDAAFAAAAIISSGAAGCWVGGILGDRWGRTRLTRLAMALSGTCCVLIGPAARLGIAPMIAVAVFWGFWVVADSAQFSSIVTETSEQRYAGTAVTLQLGAGFTLTAVTIWLIPVVQHVVGWTWAFAVLAPGPLLGVVAMTRLLHAPEARLIAGGRG